MKKLTLIFLSLMILLTGCWDSKDIETRGYVLGIAIDKYPPNPIKSEEKEGDPNQASAEEEEKLEKMELYIQPPFYAVTIQLPVLKKAELGTAAIGGGGGDESSKTWEITQIGNSFMNMNREISTRNSLALYYEHLQVIIISEAVAREGIEDIMDFFVRDPEMRRRVKMFISPGQAKSILDVNPRVEDYSSIYLARLPMNADKNSKIVHRTDLGEVINKIHAGYDFLLSGVDATKDEIKVGGAAVFSEHKMLGWISGIEVEAVKLMINTYEGGILPIRSPDDREGIITLEITKAKSTITPIISNDQLTFRIKIKVEGNYAEDINIHTHGEIDSSFMDRLEDEFSRQIEENCSKTVEKLQKFGADVILFKRVLETKRPDYWEQVGSRWDEIYPNVNVEIDADVEIMLQGIVR